MFLEAGDRRFVRACTFSLLIHAALIAWGQWPQGRQNSAPPPLQAVLRPPTAPEAPVLIAPEAPEDVEPARHTPPPPASAAPRKPALLRSASDPVTAATRQIARYLFYPPEAIERGLEGEALVMLFLDETGNALAVRLERSSGHALLDEAAVRAAQGVRGLTEGATKEVLLPVRFKLK